MIYTGGHSIDDEIIKFIEEYNVNILLSLYGLPFINEKIFSDNPNLESYSQKKCDDKNNKFFLSQYELASKARRLLELKKCDEYSTNIAISTVWTPEHSSNLELKEKTKLLTETAINNGYAVYVWEEFRQNMTKFERNTLEKEARVYSGWQELGSLYVWNRCLFGTGGAITILANGKFTNCPHTTSMSKLGIDDLFDDNYKINEKINNVIKMAHQNDELSCIIRNTYVGERLPATIRINDIMTNESVDTFIKKGLDNLTNICEEKFIDISTMKLKLKKSIAWDYSYLVDNKICLSPVLRYLYDDDNNWKKINHNIHEAHQIECDLIQEIIKNKNIDFDAIIFLGASDKEIDLLEEYKFECKDTYIIDLDNEYLLNRIEHLNNNGYNITIIDDFFENIDSVINNILKK